MRLSTSSPDAWWLTIAELILGLVALGGGAVRERRLTTRYALEYVEGLAAIDY